MGESEDDILRSLRKITRAIDVYSRHLANRFGLTGPQLVCLLTIRQNSGLTLGELARAVDLSQATVTGIIDRLEKQSLVARMRSQSDRRRISVELTAQGQDLLDKAPSPLQEQFLDRLHALPDDEQRRIRETLSQIVVMMDAEALDASTILGTGPAQASAEDLESVLEPDS